MLKYASLIVIFGCAAAVFAATTVNPATTHAPANPEIDALVKRSVEIMKQAYKTMQAHTAAGRSYLLQALSREMDRMEFAAARLERQVRDFPGDVHIIADYKKELEHYEKRVVEELAFVEAVFKNFQPSNKSSDELVQFGDKLIADGKAVLAKHPAGAKAEDLKTVEAEVKAVEAEMVHVKGMHQPSYQVEMVLLRHELTLSAAIARVQSAK